MPQGHNDSLDLGELATNPPCSAQHAAAQRHHQPCGARGLLLLQVADTPHHQGQLKARSHVLCWEHTGEPKREARTRGGRTSSPPSLP